MRQKMLVRSHFAQLALVHHQDGVGALHRREPMRDQHRCPAFDHALERMVEGRTSVLIAHRLSTVQRADTILVMHKGQLREMGSHQQLLAQRGLYWKLYQLQYKDQEIGVGTTALGRPSEVPAV